MTLPVVCNCGNDHMLMIVKTFHVHQNKNGEDLPKVNWSKRRKTSVDIPALPQPWLPKYVRLNRAVRLSIPLFFSPPAGRVPGETIKSASAPCHRALGSRGAPLPNTPWKHSIHKLLKSTPELHSFTREEQVKEMGGVGPVKTFLPYRWQCFL